ncbi:hypothetical protein BaRGS_00037808 [Batillaria attramentaria]|uniref:Uncharacterized protein n=1 Tax=Batillaria attramentaria TaxID=370345 RepID=A0ABD0J7S9_9CAEN
MIVRKERTWNFSSCLMCFLYRVRDSHPYIRLDSTTRCVDLQFGGQLGVVTEYSSLVSTHHLAGFADSGRYFSDHRATRYITSVMSIQILAAGAEGPGAG